MGHHAVEITQERFEFTSKMKNFVFLLMGSGLLLTIIGVMMGGTGDEGMKHIWSSLLLAAYYTFLLGLGGGVFLGISYLTNAGWSVAFKRIPEAMSTFLPVGAVALLLIFFLGKDYLYEWTHAEAMEIPVLKGKSSFLNIGFFTGASVVFFAAYWFFTNRLRQFSHREDEVTGEAIHVGKIFHACRRISGGFIAVFGFTFPVVAWMWMMSLEPEWFSTIYSIYNFAVMWVCSITTIAMFALFLQSQGYLKIVTKQHFHDLGKLMFAFSIFWTYIWLSQYLLIWYANIPEESKGYTDRGVGNAMSMHYTFQFWLNLILNFLCPLLIFMASTAKKTPNIMIALGAIILLGHWNDLYLMIMPGVLGDGGSIGLTEIGCTALFFGLFIYLTLNYLSKHNLIPTGHPYLKESVLHEVAP
jgi:hypothetical protein